MAVTKNEWVFWKWIICWCTAVWIHANHFAEMCGQILRLLTKVKAVASG